MLQQDRDRAKDPQKLLLKLVPSQAHLPSSQLWFLCYLLRQDTNVTVRAPETHEDAEPTRDLL